MSIREQAGINKKDAEKIGAGFRKNILDINEKPGDFFVRFIGNLKLWTRAFVPICNYDDAGDPESGWALFNVAGREGNLIAKLADEHEASNRAFYTKLYELQGKKLAEDAMDKKAYSSLRPKVNPLMYAFDRMETLGEDGIPVVKICIFNWAVWSPKKKEGIKQFQEKTSPKDPSKLLYGPIPAFDVRMTHTYDGEGNYKYDYMRHGYSAVPDDAPFRGQCPVELLDGISDEWMEKFFTEEELTAMDRADISIEKHVAPLTDDEIREKFSKQPLNLGFSYEDAEFPVFTNPEPLMALMESNDISYIPPPAHGAARITGTKAKGGSPKVAKPKKIAEEDISDAKYEEIPESEPAIETVETVDEKGTYLAQTEAQVMKMKRKELKSHISDHGLGIDPDDYDELPDLKAAIMEAHNAGAEDDTGAPVVGEEGVAELVATVTDRVAKASRKELKAIIVEFELELDPDDFDELPELRDAIIVAVGGEAEEVDADTDEIPEGLDDLFEDEEGDGEGEPDPVEVAEAVKEKKRNAAKATDKAKPKPKAGKATDKAKPKPKATDKKKKREW